MFLGIGIFAIAAVLVIVAFAVINFWLTSRIASSGGAKPAASRSRRKGVSR